MAQSLDSLPASSAIGAQFEYNRFVRRWRAERTGASHAAVVQAWQAHRAKPADDRLVDDL